MTDQIDPHLDAEVTAARQWFSGRRFILTGRMWRDRTHIERSIKHLGGTVVRDSRGLAPGTVTLVIGDTGRHGITAKVADARRRGVVEMPSCDLRTKIQLANTAPVAFNPGPTVNTEIDRVKRAVQQRLDREVAENIHKQSTSGGLFAIDPAAAARAQGESEPVDVALLADAEAALDLD